MLPFFFPPTVTHYPFLSLFLSVSSKLTKLIFTHGRIRTLDAPKINYYLSSFLRVTMKTMFQLLLLLLLLLITILFASSSSSSSSYSSDDSFHLQSFRSSSDRHGLLWSWRPGSDPCSGSWLGVYCRSGRVTRLVLQGLSLSGTIQAVSLLPHLRVVSLKNNTLSDPLHALNLSLWQPHLKLLYLSDNHFSGPFPECVILLRHLRRLDLAGNLLSGRIPGVIGFLLPRLLTLRVENNLLSGGIPDSIGKIQGLADLNVSHNHLVGEIPGNLSLFPASSFRGNRQLCGKPLLLATLDCPKPQAAPRNSKSKSRKYWMLQVSLLILILVAVLTILVSAGFLSVREWRPRVDREGSKEAAARDSGEGDGCKEERLVFFEGCEEFVMEDLMRGSAEMLGRGVVGSTYRVVMGCGGVVVKRVRKEIRLGKERRRRSRRWAEVEGLLGEVGRWRHPNVATLLAYYSSDDELLLVFQYVSKGSLHNLLHGNRGAGRIPLGWPARFKIALGAAKGLAFLHRSTTGSNLCHQHLTSSNILISEDGDALISDFALHQLLSDPPEKTTTRKNALKSDVYSFGVVLLEILTGRREGDGGADLAQWVQEAVKLQEWTSEVLDIELPRCKGTENEMVALLQVALLCLTSDPKHRPTMSTVHRMIEDIEERGCGGGGGGAQLSPSAVDTSCDSSPCLSEDTATTSCNIE